MFSRISCSCQKRRGRAAFPSDLPRFGMTMLLSIILPVVLLVVPVQAQPAPQLLWSFQANGNMQAIASCPDIDGDGGPDIVFEGYENGPSGVDHVFAIRGRSFGVGEVLWSARPIGGASSGGGWGDNCLRMGPDLNGDGFPEVLLSTAWGGRTAYALDGRTGATVWSFDTYAYYGQSGSGWIYAMDSLDSDLTGDGVPEILFCSGSSNDRVHCVNGANGAFVWAYYGQDAFFDVRSCQDINNDGVRDVVAALGDNTPISARVVALSGVNGGFIWQCPVQSSIWNLTFIDDLDGDSIREIVPSQWGNNLTCISGRTGSVVWTRGIGAQQRVATLDDVNGDGIQDVAVGFNLTNACRVCSGADGTTIWNRPTSDWTWAIDRVADCTGDGINDVVVGDFDGIVYVLDGVDGTIFWSWRNPTWDKIKTIRGAPDLNGNGAPDVVAGTQLLYGGTGGDVYALEGNSEAAAAPEGPPFAIRLQMSEAFPNPSAGPITWSLTAPHAAAVRVLLYGPDGRRVGDLGERHLAPGARIPLHWDARDEAGAAVPGGVYLARLFADGRPVIERKAVVIR